MPPYLMRQLFSNSSVEFKNLIKSSRNGDNLKKGLLNPNSPGVRSSRQQQSFDLKP
jgi:hypothetical protein